MRNLNTREQANSVAHMASDEERVAPALTVGVCYQPLVSRAFATAGLAANLGQTGSLPQLLYDSFAQPILAGVRSAGMNVRQMLFRADPYQIDFQVEVQPQHNRVVVTGQVLDVEHPGVVNAGMQFTLSDGREDVIGTVTNQFGEFRGEVNNSGFLELSFLVRGEKPIVILLRGALDSPAKAKN